MVEGPPPPHQVLRKGTKGVDKHEQRRHPKSPEPWLSPNVCSSCRDHRLFCRQVGTSNGVCLQWHLSGFVVDYEDGTANGSSMAVERHIYSEQRAMSSKNVG